MLFTLEELIIKSVKVPFTARAIVDEERVLDVLEELRSSLPRELSQAQELLSQRDEMLRNAQARAEGIMVEAREMANRMVSQTELVAAARAEVERMFEEAQANILTQQAGADRYADEVLAELEAKIARALSTIQNGRSQLGIGG